MVTMIYGKDGYDEEGYYHFGRDSQGFTPPSGKRDYNEKDYDEEGFNKYGYDREGFSKMNDDQHPRPVYVEPIRYSEQKMTRSYKVRYIAVAIIAVAMPFLTLQFHKHDQVPTCQTTTTLEQK